MQCFKLSSKRKVNAKFHHYFILDMSSKTTMEKQSFDINQLSKISFIERFFNTNEFKSKVEIEKSEQIVIKNLKVFKRFFDKNQRLVSIVVKYQVSYDGKQKEIFGIAHYMGLWKPIFEYQKYLYQSGFSFGDVKTNKPVGYFDDLKALFYYNAPGIPLIKAIETGGFNLEDIFFKIGKGLAKLHLILPKKAPKYTKKDEQGFFVDYSLYVLKEKKPSQSEKISELVHEIYQQEKNYLEKFSFTHGDFHPKNIIVENGQIYFIDFSNAVIFERESDNGDFLAQVFGGYFDFDQEKAIGREKILELEETFKKGYFTLIEEDDYTKKAISLFKARTLVKIVIHVIHWKDFQNKREQDLINRNLKEARRQMAKIC